MEKDLIYIIHLSILLYVKVYNSITRNIKLSVIPYLLCVVILGLLNLSCFRCFINWCYFTNFCQILVFCFFYLSSDDDEYDLSIPLTVLAHFTVFQSTAMLINNLRNQPLLTLRWGLWLIRKINSNSDICRNLFVYWLTFCGHTNWKQCMLFIWINLKVKNVLDTAIISLNLRHHLLKDCRTHYAAWQYWNVKCCFDSFICSMKNNLSFFWKM